LLRVLEQRWRRKPRQDINHKVPRYAVTICCLPAIAVIREGEIGSCR
jgi:hypothetical protein